MSNKTVTIIPDCERSDTIIGLKTKNQINIHTERIVFLLLCTSLLQLGHSFPHFDTGKFLEQLGQVKLGNMCIVFFDHITPRVTSGGH